MRLRVILTLVMLVGAALLLNLPAKGRLQAAQPPAPLKTKAENRLIRNLLRFKRSQGGERNQTAIRGPLKPWTDVTGVTCR